MHITLYSPRAQYRLSRYKGQAQCNQVTKDTYEGSSMHAKQSPTNIGLAVLPLLSSHPDPCAMLVHDEIMLSMFAPTGVTMPTHSFIYLSYDYA